MVLPPGDCDGFARQHSGSAPDRVAHADRGPGSRTRICVSHSGQNSSPIATVALKGIVGTVHWANEFRIADLRVPTPTLAVAITAGVSLVVAMIMIRRRRSLCIVGLLALAGTAFSIARIPPSAHLPGGALEVTAIDVGQADSTLLVTPDPAPFWTCCNKPKSRTSKSFNSLQAINFPMGPFRCRSSRRRVGGKWPENLGITIHWFCGFPTEALRS